jgi:hypothetical protein
VSYIGMPKPRKLVEFWISSRRHFLI